jgi:hypothetical protein
VSKVHTSKKNVFREDLKNKGYSVLLKNEIHLAPDLQVALACLGSTFDDAPNDGSSRRRFYSRYIVGPYATVDALDLRPYSSSFMSSDYQQADDINPEQYGALRSYAPLPASVWSNSLLREMIFFDLNLLPLSDFWLNARRNPVSVGIHLIRMVALPDKPSVPSPSIPHQDGEPFTFIHLINRRGVAGGDSQVFRNVPVNGFNTRGELIGDFTLENSLDSLAVWDRDVFHHVTAVEVAEGHAEGVRDVLIIDFTPLEECKFNSTGSIGFNPHNFRTELRQSVSSDLPPIAKKESTEAAAFAVASVGSE